MKLQGQFYVLLHLDVKNQQQMESKDPTCPLWRSKMEK